MTGRTAILLDVDGVVSPLAAPGRRARRLRIDGAVGQRVRRLVGLGEVVWLTAWDAATRGVLESTFGLPPLRAIPTADPASVLPAVAGWIGANAPDGGWRGVAWIDDELFGDALDWAEAAPFPVELVRPDPVQGLRDEHVARIEAFLAGLPA